VSRACRSWFASLAAALTLSGCNQRQAAPMAIFDPSKRESLMALVRRNLVAAPADAVSVVSLESFFDGNRDQGSIGCNLSPHPGLDRFRDILTRLRNNPNVQDVLVEIDDVSDPSCWPFSGAVHVFTSLSAADLASLAADLRPEEPLDEKSFVPHNIVGLPSPRPGMRRLSLWWD
jgi:hypothetical protein